MDTLRTGAKRSLEEFCDSEDIHSPRPKPKAVMQKQQCSWEPIPPPGPSSYRPRSPDRAYPTASTGKSPFEIDASILLVGIRGVGKSSLGFLAATAYSRHLVESDRAFLEAAGLTRTAYRKSHSTDEYHRKHAEIFRQLLHSRSRNCVIVCNFADLEGDGAAIVQEFSHQHPVIYVSRDVTGIQQYIRVWETDRILDLIRASEALLRECSNYEFFNVTETSGANRSSYQDTSRVVPERASNGVSLTLKRAERDFLKFLRNILGDHDRGRSHQSAYPLSQISVDKLEFTSAVSLNSDDIISGHVDLDDAQVGVDAIQLTIGTRSRQRGRLGKVDCLNLASEAFAIVRRSTILPVIMAVAAYDEDEDTCHDHPTKFELLKHCLRLAPEYCTWDLRLEEAQLALLATTQGRTKAIGEYIATKRPVHGWRDDVWTEKYQQAEALCCDLVRFVMPGIDLDDNFAMQTLRPSKGTSRSGKGPGIMAYCTGRYGRTSMCFNRILSPVAAVKSMSGNMLSNGTPLPTAKERNAALFASFIHEPLRFFIYGANVSFSLSPAMHNAAYSACGIPHLYRTHSASTLDDFAILVRESDFGGAALVQPFKRTALAMMDILSPHAKAIGAVNTCIPLRYDSITEAGRSEAGIFCERNRTGPVQALYGDNTDWIGIRACIRRGLSPANTVRPSSTGLVCGAGGMARAAIYAMISLGVQNIVVCNRTKGRAEELAEHYNGLLRTETIAELSSIDAANTRITALESFNTPWPRHVRHPTMIVSCIPTQTLDGASTNFVLPQDWLGSRTGGVVVELAYMPIVTPLVRQMQGEAQRGWILMDGLDMLPEQAFAQFELFTGRRAPRKLMRNEVIKHYSEDEYPLHGALNLDSPQHA